MSYLVAGIGAGLVSALLFAVVITGSPLAMLLYFLAPLPVFVAALGWRHRAGLVAAIIGALALAVLLRYQFGLAYAITFALPAWAIAYMALLGRDLDHGTTEWYPIGRLLLWLGGTAALVTLGGAMATVGDYGTYISGMQRAITAVLSGAVRGFPAPRLPEGITPEDAANGLAFLAPFVAGAFTCLILTANLWLAAKAVHMSGRLPRPWPFVPSLALPIEAVWVSLGAIALAFMPAYFGFFGMAIIGAMTTAFMLNGLAGIHDISIGKPMRFGMLFVLYLGLFIGIGAMILMPLIIIFGFVDCAFRLRARRNQRPPFTPTTT